MQGAEDISSVAPAVVGLAGTAGVIVVVQRLPREQGATQPSTEVAEMPGHALPMCMLNTGLGPM